MGSAGHSGHFGALKRPSQKPSANMRIKAKIHGHRRVWRAGGAIPGVLGVAFMLYKNRKPLPIPPSDVDLELESMGG
jgi:hypothetical protein